MYRTVRNHNAHGTSNRRYFRESVNYRRPTYRTRLHEANSTTRSGYRSYTSRRRVNELFNDSVFETTVSPRYMNDVLEVIDEISPSATVDVDGNYVKVSGISARECQMITREVYNMTH